MENPTVATTWGPGAAKWALAIAVSTWASIPVMGQTLLLLQVLDFSLGMMKASRAGKLCMQEARRGLQQKTATILVLVATHLAVRAQPTMAFGVGVIAAAFVFSELLSIVLNAADLGVPIPPALIEVLAKARKMTGRGVPASKVRAELDGPDPKEG